MISVIVPVYNVEPYLRKCLDSIINQTYSDLEILVIDDGSTDGSGKICDEYVEKDERIKVFHTENRGLSAARNLGLDEAHGDWISFVDSDDWVERDFCKIPYELAISHKADIVIFRFKSASGKERKWSFSSGIKTKDEAIRLIHSEASVVVWNKMFQKRLFRNIRFPVGKLYEDNAVTHKLIHCANCIYYSDMILYNKLRRPGNITSSMTINKEEELFEMRMVRYQDLQNWGYKKEAEYVKQQAMFSYLKSIGKNGKHSVENIAYLKEVQPLSQYLGWKAKTMIATLRMSRLIFDAICTIFVKRSFTCFNINKRLR